MIQFPDAYHRAKTSYLIFISMMWMTWVSNHLEWLAIDCFLNTSFMLTTKNQQSLHRLKYFKYFYIGLKKKEESVTKNCLIQKWPSSLLHKCALWHKSLNCSDELVQWRTEFERLVPYLVPNHYRNQCWLIKPDEIIFQQVLSFILYFHSSHKSLSWYTWIRILRNSTSNVLTAHLVPFLVKLLCCGCQWSEANISSDNGLVPSGNRPLPELMLKSLTLYGITRLQWVKKNALESVACQVINFLV